MDLHLVLPTHASIAILILTLSLYPTTWAIKIILMYASCDDQLTYILHLLHSSIKPHIVPQEEEGVVTNDDEAAHVRHNLSDACMWVLHDTVAVVAITNETEKWTDIDTSAHEYNLPHFVSPNLCQCSPYRITRQFEYAERLERAVYEFLRSTDVHYIIVLHEDERTDGTYLSNLLTPKNVRILHLQLSAGGPNILKRVERFFDSLNLVDLSDEGRLLISLGGGTLADNLLKNLIESNMHNKRTKLLVFDNPEKWQRRLKNVKAYEVDLVVVSPDPLPMDDCPVAIEVILSKLSTNKMNGQCTNLSSEYNLLGSSILENFEKNFTQGCCPRSGLGEIFFTFWQSWPYENGTQNLKPEAVWSENLGILRMLPIDIETITLRIAVLSYHPYIILNETGNEPTLKECVLRHLLKFLSKKLNFKYKLVTPPDGQWGSRKKPGVWDGSIGMITRGEADIIPYLTSTPSRREVVDFSKPIAYVKYGILVAFPSEPPRAFIFLRPYRKEVWLLFIVTAIIISFILHKIHRWSCKFCRADRKSTKGLSTFSRCLWLIFGAMLNQGGVNLPVTNSARLVLASWWLAVLVIMATFSANLIAYLAFPEIRWIVKTLEDMVQHNTIQLTIKEDCPVLEDFRESNLDIYTNIRKTFLDNPKRGKVITSKRGAIVQEVIEGKSVFIDDVNFLNRMVMKDYIAAGRCRLTISPDKFSRMDLALGFRRGSSLLPYVNKEIQQMLENGVFAHWLSNVSQHRDECFDFINNLHGQSEIKLEDLQGPFYLLAIGLVFALLFLSCEFMVNRIMIAYRRYSKSKYFGREDSTLRWRYGMQ